MRFRNESEKRNTGGVALLLASACLLPATLTTPAAAGSCPAVVSPQSIPCSGNRAAERLEMTLSGVTVSDFALHQGLAESLRHYALETVDPVAMRQQLDATGTVSLSLAGQSRQLVLEAVDLRAPSWESLIVTEDADIRLPAGPVDTFKGHVAGQPRSQVRLLIDPDLVMGYVELDGRRFFIDPAYKFVPGGGSNRLVIYQEADLLPEPGIDCALTEVREHAQGLDARSADAPGDQHLVAGAPSKRFTLVRWVDFATDADFEYYAIHGSGTNAHIRGIVNMINGFYGDTALIVKVASQRVFTSQGGDPYSTCSVWGQWCELWDEWETNRQGVARDVAYLFSGKALFWDLPNGFRHRVRGTANMLGTVCDLDRAYVLSTDYREVGLVSHELGHALDGRHLRDSLSLSQELALCPDVDCGADTCGDPNPAGGPVMCGHIQQPTLDFHPVTVSEIKSFVASSGSCLSPVIIPYWP
ncbi:MAG: hypothetical protein GY719_27065 [bacterium]|nr:hypothetical protein [bacterium]